MHVWAAVQVRMWAAMRPRLVRTLVLFTLMQAG